MSGDIHVIPHQKGWAIAIGGTGYKTPYPTKEAAVIVATALAKSARVELLIYGRDGQIRERILRL